MFVLVWFAALENRLQVYKTELKSYKKRKSKDETSKATQRVFERKESAKDRLKNLDASYFQKRWRRRSLGDQRSKSATKLVEQCGFEP